MLLMIVLRGCSWHLWWWWWVWSQQSCCVWICKVWGQVRKASSRVRLSTLVSLLATNQCTQCSAVASSVLFRCLSANFSALVTYWLTTVFATCWVKSVGTNVESLWMVVVHTSMRCILDHGRGKVCEWGRGNGAYWIDGVEEAHRQMVPHQGNLNRHLPSSSSMGFTTAATLSVFDWWYYSGRSTLHNSCNC